MSNSVQLTPIQEFYKGKTIFITGGSGFMGKVSSCNLLLHTYQHFSLFRLTFMSTFFNVCYNWLTLYSRFKITDLKFKFLQIHFISFISSDFSNAKRWLFYLCSSFNLSGFSRKIAVLMFGFKKYICASTTKKGNVTRSTIGSNVQNTSK